MKVVNNEFKNGQRFYALHMNEGVAEYRPDTEEMHRLLIQEKVIREMDATFTGCPVYVGHVDTETEDGVVGYVVKSFFNKADGKHWAEILVFDEIGLNAIRKKYRVSNAYLPEEYAGGGRWQGVDYDKEVMKASYKHLALVDDPRYSQTMVLTPDEFKLYNQNKELELLKVANSQDTSEKKNEEIHTMKFWKKAKIENAEQFKPEEIMVQLEQSKKEITLKNAIDLADKHEKQNGYAMGDHKVKINEGEEMTVNELVEAYKNMCAKKNEDEDTSKDKVHVDIDSHNEEDEDMKNEGDEDESKQNADIVATEEEARESKAHNSQTKKNNFERIKNANKHAVEEYIDIRVEADKAALGRQRYGSAKK